MAMSTSSASAAGSTPSTVACSSNLYDIPVQDASCAIPFDDDATDIMAQCCQNAPVISYYDDCGLYCLASGQSVEDLTSCLMDGGAQPQDVFCRGNVTASATGTSNSVPTDAQASIVAGPTGGSGSGSGGDGMNGVDSGSDSDSDSNDSRMTGIAGSMGYGGLVVGALAVLALPFWFN